MPQCSYCGEEFADEDAYLRHLRETHTEELGRIDKRRVQALEGEAGVSWWALGVGVLAVLGVLGGAAFLLLGGDGPPEATYDPDVHVHGTMVITIEGEELPLSGSSEYADNDRIFHFHGNEMEQYGVHQWHIHGTDVTLQYALETLGIDVNHEGTILTYDGETYDDAHSNTTVAITVNGETVEPGAHELDGVVRESDVLDGAGDDVEVRVVRSE